MLMNEHPPLFIYFLKETFLCLCFFRHLVTHSQVSDRSSNEDRRQCTDHNAQNHCKGEAADTVTTQHEDTQQYDQLI